MGIKLFSFLFPVFHFALSMGLIFLAQYLRLAFPASCFVVFIAAGLLVLILFLEAQFTNYFEGMVNGGSKATAGLFFRLLLWLAIFYVFVQKPVSVNEASDEVFLRVLLSASIILRVVKYILISNIILSAALISVNVVFYLLITVRLRKWRMVSLVILPGLSLYLLSIVHYHVLLFKMPDGEISRQKGVTIFFSPQTIRKKESKEMWNYPRMLWVDGGKGKIYASFGSTFGEANDCKRENFWQIDMNTKTYKTIDLCQLWAFTKDPHNDTIYAAPKSANDTFNILAIDKNSFIVKEYFNYKRDAILPFAPQGLLEINNDIYVSGEISNVMFKYNIAAKKIEKVLDFKKHGMAQLGEMGSNSMLEAAHYLITEVGVNGNIAFVSPERLSLEKAIRLPDYQSGRLSNVGRNGLLFNISFADGIVYEINVKTFTSRKLYKLPDSWCLFYDDENDVLYSFDYFKGKFLVVDRKSGKIENYFWVGNKPYSMDVTKHFIYVLSASGIIRISRKEVLKKNTFAVKKSAVHSS